MVEPATIIVSNEISKRCRNSNFCCLLFELFLLIVEICYNTPIYTYLYYLYSKKLIFTMTQLLICLIKIVKFSHFLSSLGIYFMVLLIVLI